MVICHLKPLIGRLERGCSTKQFLSKSTTESSPFLSYKKRQRRFDTFAQRLAWELNCFICFKFRSHLLPTLLPFINFVKERTRPSSNSDALQLSYGRHVGIRPLIWAHVVIATKGSARSKKCKSILLKYFAFTSFACTDRFMKREKSKRFPLPLSTFWLEN